ncbi:nudix hydrolase 8-like [Haliotis rufescens]|uniref:nudix hydrolase 8-like n=1 Tax=Haliotis rufescens TaxID=6454 RepID=UPI001EB00CAB|nr:nudix hydrolase 8-like [Haliotis rufescens]XP_048257213.1 nudix hydrolase 8-like [Haliotis rufescens]
MSFNTTVNNKMADKFVAKRDRFNSITFSVSDQTFASDEELIQNLEAALTEWRNSKVRGVWVKIGLQQTALVPRLVKLGFDFHHAQPGYVMMSVWLPADEPNNLPEYANQYIGVGGFVVNSKHQVLAIQERFQSRPHWKLPGGHADKGEDIGETAKREVFEETGIECDFESVLTFRHQHNYRYGCSDIYFVCVMRPRSDDLKPCKHEIAKCQWMDLDEYINHKEMSVGNRHIAQCYKDSLSQGGLALVPSPVISFSGKVYNKMYSVQHKDKVQTNID